MFLRVLNKNRANWLAHGALAAGLVLAVAVSGWLGPFSASCASLRQDTLRLHVQANSNSDADQALKLLVRDAVLETARSLFADLPDQRTALETARAHLADFQQAAEQVVREQGSDQAVRVYVTNMYFPTTAYEEFTLPAGRYDALRVELGEHAGRNWFCVLYPALCLSAAQPAEYPQQDQQELLENSRSYEVRFAALEAVERLGVGTRKLSGTSRNLCAYNGARRDAVWQQSQRCPRTSERCCKMEARGRTRPRYKPGSTAFASNGRRSRASRWTASTAGPRFRR